MLVKAPYMLMQSCLCKSFQRTFINGPFSNWTEIMTKASQGSILGSQSFNIFLNDMSLLITNSKLCNYTDDNAFYCIGKNLSVVKSNLDVISRLYMYGSMKTTWH